MKRYSVMLLVSFLFCSLVLHAAEESRWEYSFIKGLNYEEKEELEKAIQELEKSNEQKPKDPLILRELGYCYGKQGNYIKSEQYYEEVLFLLPEDKNALKNLVLIEEVLGNQEKRDEYQKRLSM